MRALNRSMSGRRRTTRGIIGCEVSAVESLESRRLLSAVYHVSATGGSDAANGSQTSPWATLQKAANTVQAGDVVIVHAGNYAGFDLWTSGTASQRITFTAESGVVINAPNSRTADGINLEGADYVTIAGFRVVGMPRAGIRSVVNDGVIIRNNIADQNGYWGILTGFSENILIENNITSRSANQHGIYVGNSADNPVIRNNTVWGNRASGIQINADRWAGGDGIITNALIENNVIYGNGAVGGAAINLDGVQTSRIQNNLLYDNHASGIALFAIDGAAGSKNNVVVNNSILQAADARWAVVIVSGSTGNQLFNNIILTHHVYRGSITVSADSLSGLQSDYNVVSDRFSPDNEATRITLAQWRALTGQDQHSVVASPSQTFVDPTSNYRPLTGGPAIDLGVGSFAGVMAPTIDLAGASRPQGASFDAGAFELVASTPTNRAPTGISLDNATVLEGTSGATIGQLTVADPDVGDTHTVSVDDARFDVVGGVLKLKNDADLDYEANPAVTIRITATDVGGLSLTQAFVISVVNRPSVVDVRYGYGNGKWVSANDTKGRKAPWQVTKIQFRFDTNVRVDVNDLTARGSFGGNLSFSAFTYDAATFTATWTLASPVERDHLTFSLDGDDAGPDGNDGVSSAVSSSAYMEGGDYPEALDVLFGDVSGDGQVDLVDALLQRGRNGTSDRWADLNGDGIVNLIDALLLRGRNGTSLP